MKRWIFCCLVVVAGLCARSEKYVFSADGVTVGSAPRDLPSQGYDRITHQVVVGLGMRTDAEKAACGWWRIVETPPPGIVVSNEIWVASGYTFTNSVAYQGWAKRWRKVVPVKYSRLSIYMALANMGKWETAKAWMEQQGLYTAFMLAQEISSDHPQFVAGKAQLQSVLGWTDAQIEALLKECILK